MQFTLKKLILILSVACVVAVATGNYLNSPERRIRRAGVDYDTKYKAGTFLHLPNGAHFDNESLANVIAIAADFSHPHHIGVSGKQVTDDGFRAFQNAPKIGGIWLSNLSVSDEIFRYFDKMPDLSLIHISEPTRPY